MAESPKKPADLAQAGGSREVKSTRSPGSPSAETARAADSVPAPIGPFASLPMRFGRYEIQKELGRGQMGAVYLANDVELDRLVALKVARISASGSAKILKRMEVEAKAAAKIDHPLICKVYDAGEIDGIRFIALQYIEGEDLKQYQKRVGRKRPAGEAVRLVLQILRALEAAHAQGVIHRDLKPENVMLNKNREPVIMDFGLARRTIASSNAGLTQGMIVGTAAYMSPEQATGKAEEIDHRSDIYAIGVVLFEMLTGEWPFTGGAMEVMGKKCVQEPPSPLKVDSTLNPELAAVCHKMIAKNKVDRFVACAEVIRIIESVNLSTDSSIQAKVESAKTDSPIPFDFTNEPKAARLKCNSSQGVSTKSGVHHKPTFDVFRFATRYWTGATLVVRRAALISAGACLLVLAVILFFPTPHGVVRIEIDDATLKVKFQGSTITVDNDNQPINVTATSRHTLEVLQNDVTVESATRELILNKGETRILKVTLLDGKIIVVDGDSPSVAPLQKTLERILDGPIVLEPVVPPVDRSQNVELSRDAPLTIGFETPAFQRWTNEVAALPAEKQVEAVSKKLQELNPGFDGKLFGIEMTGTPKIENGHVKTMCFFADDIIDISPVRVLKELDNLWCNGSSTGKGKVSDLSPLKGMKLRQLRCLHTQVSDLSPLREMTSLGYLHVEDTKVCNLSPLQELRLGTFHCSGTPIKDLTPLKGVPLHALSFGRSQVADLSPLKGLQLLYIDFELTTLADLSPLKDMPLLEVRFGGTSVFDLLPLREMRSLKVIRCPRTKVADLSPLKGLNLSVVDIWNTGVSDLSPLQEMKLTYLDINNTKVSDLSPLKGQPLATLRCFQTGVSDLSPLQGMPLTEISLVSKDIDLGMDVLRPMKSLKTIIVNGKQMAPDEFWRKYDDGQFGKAPPVTSQSLGIKSALSPADAAKKIDEQIVVEMEVKSTGGNGNCYLHSEEDFKDSTNFTIFIKKDHLDKFKIVGIESPAAYYKGKFIQVSGTVILDNEKPRINVDEPSQIKIVTAERKKP